MATLCDKCLQDAIDIARARRKIHRSNFPPGERALTKISFPYRFDGRDITIELHLCDTHLVDLMLQYGYGDLIPKKDGTIVPVVASNETVGVGNS